MKDRIMKTLYKNKTINRILKTVFKEKNGGKPGVTISELSEKTGIERHRLAGILEVLVLLGLIAVIEMGMMKVVTTTATLERMRLLIR